MITDFDARLSPLVELLAAAEEHPGRDFITIAGVTSTYAEAWAETCAVAQGLRSLGVREGERVVLLLPNRVEAVWAWFGAQLIGAIDAPISVEAPGPFLDYLMADLEPSVVIGTPQTLARVAEAVTTPVSLAVVVDEAGANYPLGAHTAHVMWSALLELGRNAGGDVQPPSPYMPGTIMYSSGTTGPSKGVVLSQGYYSTLAIAHIRVAGWEEGYRAYCTQPLCHVDGRSAVIDCLHVRGHVRMGTRFSASRFWAEVEEHDADIFFYVGTMIHLLDKQPERPLPPGAKRRVGMGSATPPPIHRSFESRFNVELIEGYGMTELGIMVGQRRGASEPGHIGRALPWIDVEVFDDNDEPVPDGSTGELVARPHGPHVHMLGYWNRPDATVEAWRNLWFHSGDLVQRREDGTFIYVGRTKDSIRRRGENVSAWEVEQAACRHELVLEAAAIGVPSDVGDEDVALLVVPHPAGAPEPSALRDFVAQYVPRFAVPRYVELVDSLPKTPSERIAKGQLKERGLSANTFDAELAR